MTQGALLSIALCSVMHSSAYTCAHAQFDVTCLLLCIVAGFCLKTRTDAEEKVFINVCTSDLVRIGKHVVCLSVCMCLCVVHVCCACVFVCCACVFVCCAMCLCVVQCVCVLCVYGLLQFTV